MTPQEILDRARELRWALPQNFHDRWVENAYAESARIAGRNVDQAGEAHRLSWQRRLDWLFTNRWTGLPIMLLMLATVLWITIIGANIPLRLARDAAAGLGPPVPQRTPRRRPTSRGGSPAYSSTGST